MDSLKKMYMDLEFTNIHTYIQSGNVIFQTVKSKPNHLEHKIKDVIFKGCGFDVPVIVKDFKELNAVLTNNPFIKKKDIDITKLHVIFLSQIPEQSGLNNIKQNNFLPDEFIISGKTIYLYCPNGYGNTKLNNNFFENKLKVTATTRNWKTINELVKIAESLVH